MNPQLKLHNKEYPAFIQGKGVPVDK